MNNIYSRFTEDDLWLIKQTEWVTAVQNIRETQFALGNGYMGTRGILQDMPEGAMPGLFLAGLYDKSGSQVDELVNWPNPVNFMFTIEGQKMDVISMDVTEHRRALNMKKAVLAQHTVYRDRKKRRYDYQSLRFISMRNKNIGAMQIAFTPLDGDAIVDINTGIDVSITNAGILTEGKKKHFRVKELSQENHAGYVAVESLQRKHVVICWSGFYYEMNGDKQFAKDNIFQLRIKKNQTIVFTKIFFIKHFPYADTVQDIKTHTAESFQKVFQGDFSRLLDDHIREWDMIWKRTDVIIKGVANIQQNLRFNIYHMLITGHYDDGFSSIGARTLSGEGYRGHIFWDGEIFLLPFYLFTYPEIAKNMLLYRYRRLDTARRLAQKEGYRGAKFPWESASTGEEETPEWARDFDGKIIRIHTQEMEHHITADIAHAVYRYHIVTGDDSFMENYGYEIIFETARFWASRVEYKKRSGTYEINSIIGPDEFHLKVKNNAFTNMMAKWNLLIANKMFTAVKKNAALYRALKNRLGLAEKEARDWKGISDTMNFSIGKDNLIEQFEGYFKLKKILLTKTDENGLPFLPKALKGKDLGKTQLVKQADVLMLLFILDDMFSNDVIKANYDFYMKRTVHASSLSVAIHSLLACYVGDLQKAYNFFNVGLRADISNVYGNTKEGMHAASLGGAWQAVVFGFAGVRVRKGTISINPGMPYTWQGMEFSLVWRGSFINLNLTNDIVKIKVDSPKKEMLEAYVFDKMAHVKPGKWMTFERSVHTRKREYVHY
jgi:kojibiose phosphorylase